jgi:AcrR family transcriptional regulator
MSLRAKQIGACAPSELRHGRAGAPRARPGVVSGAQRERLVAITEQLVCDAGAERLTVAEVCAAACVTADAFHSVFHDRDECLHAVFDGAVERAAAAMSGAYRAGGSWPERVRGALHELLAFLDERPGLARFLIVGSLAGDATMRARRDELLTALAGALEADCPPASPGSLPAPFGADAIVGALAAILHSRLREIPVPPLQDMCGALMGVIVLPYLDTVGALRVLSPQAGPSAVPA